MISHHPNQ